MGATRSGRGRISGELPPLLTQGGETRLVNVHTFSTIAHNSNRVLQFVLRVRPRCARGGRVGGGVPRAAVGRLECREGLVRLRVLYLVRVQPQRQTGHRGWIVRRNIEGRLSLTLAPL